MTKSTKKTKILLEKHPHELNLLFHFPYEDNTGVFECDVCQGKVARKEESSSSHNEYLVESATRKVEDIQAFDEAQEMVMAARIEAQLRAQGRNAALDLIDSGSRRKKYYYC
ncbi:Hypothetical predicted protein [Olea europaea subsp. europaea]|uniref:Uncharacterized protein n=1 Tax=Olea europaea subsp. europaea TaxID=158383 RepID=A0A8S0PLA3_OLEEU|nr:Hypothetical predicted protein [Olea europaea subsp. europaea]